MSRPAIALTLLLAGAAAAAFAQPAPSPIARATVEADRIADPHLRLAVYTDLLPVLGRLKQADALGRISAAGMKLARASADRAATGEFCATVAVAYALAGDRDRHERWMHDAILAGAWSDRRLAWPALARARLEGGDADGAGQLATALDTATDRAACLADLAAIAARKNDRETAFDFVRLALANVRAADRPDEALARIVDVQLLIATRPVAEQAVAPMKPGHWRAYALARIAQGALLAGDSNNYHRLTTRAVDAASNTPGGALAQAQALLAVARLRAEAGDATSAKQTCDDARTKANDIPPDQRAGFHLALAGVLSRAGDPAGAAEAARAARATFRGQRAQLAAEDEVASLIAGGLLAEALTTADAIAERNIRARALANVAEAYEITGDLPALTQLTKKLDPHCWQAARIVGRAHARNPQNAVATLAESLPDPATKSGLWAGAAEK